MSCFVLRSENIKTLAKAIIDLSRFPSPINVPDVFRYKNLDILAANLYRENVIAYDDRYGGNFDFDCIDWDTIPAADIVGNLECGKIFQWHFDLLNLVSCYHYQICDSKLVNRDILYGIESLKNKLALLIAFNDPRMKKGWVTFF